MTPAAGGSCFELHVGTGDDTTFTINTAGIAGIAVYAQHVPIEFERDTHYLYDSSSVDIEPIAEESAGGHAHGHRRLVDVDAALHTYEDSCDAVNCYIESEGCVEEAVSFEWAGVFEVADATHTWSMQKVDGAYADPSMRLAIIPTSTPTEAFMETTENVGSNLLLDASCTVVEDGETMTPA